MEPMNSVLMLLPKDQKGDGDYGFHKDWLEMAIRNRKEYADKHGMCFCFCFYFCFAKSRNSAKGCGAICCADCMAEPTQTDECFRIPIHVGRSCRISRVL